MRHGSPPQVRGKPSFTSTCSQPSRITPAGAGKTQDNLYHSRHKRDHPRRCGENELSATVACRMRGSPPQVRGKPLVIVSAINFSGSPPQVRGKLASSSALLRGLRITPAGAGKTISTAGYENNGMDHPRRCGENAPFLRRTVRRPGSPPQVRGKRLPSSQLVTLPRITPAGAGKTGHSSRMRRWKRDHPRRCGENPS